METPNNELIPASMQPAIRKFADELCAALTQWEQGEISDYELYDFMVDLQNNIDMISYD